MPVRSLSSSVLKWPDKEAVDFAVRRWAQHMAGERKDVLQIGYFGSYARGDWGVGSDLDLIVIVESSSEPMERRAAKWDTTELPVPADLLVYAEDEWKKMRSQERFGRTVMREAVWVYQK
jgi:predicted nucleotidyltransferase